jgi:transglutaminase-like putative cysteine protease
MKRAWMAGGALLAAAAVAAGAKEYLRMDADSAYLKDGETRTMAITYRAIVRDVPVGTKRLRVWVPVPQDSPVQRIAGLEFPGPLAPRLTTEGRYGNRLAYWDIENPAATMRLAPDAKTFEWSATVAFTAARKEQVTDLAKLAEDGKSGDAAEAEFLKADRLTIVDDRIRKMAAEVTAGKTTAVAKARAIYEHVYERMTYDKSGQGWGLGDTNFACEVGKGNCTDFHALFQSLCRASGIPAGFEIGLYAPYARKSDEKLGGYHCWAFFRVPGKAWVPVDISEADRFPDRKEYFFGSHTSNRVTLSVGRDLVLEPKQDGEPLNYMLNPHAEADGKPLPASKDWTCKDVD